ncbi:bidirectional sugar transporter SWEET8 [Capsella rubella]|nr:bidirectional sugar transporter SWEET8 [Capsella rubella]
MIHGLWVLYGLPLFHKDGILVTTSNGIGCLIEIIYLVVFLIYCSDESCRSNTWYSLASGIPLVLVLLYGTSLTESESLSTLHITIGVICDVLTTGVDIKIALTYENVPVWFYLAKFINAGVWLAYSLIYKLDIFVLISSGLGMLLCASQLIFCSNRPIKPAQSNAADTLPQLSTYVGVV